MAEDLSKPVKLNSLLEADKGAIRLELRLSPNAKRSAITGTGEDANGRVYLKASVTAIPENGKANAALIKLLSKEWKIAKSTIRIRREQTNPRKTIEIAGEIDRVRPLISAWLEKLAINPEKKSKNG